MEALEPFCGCFWLRESERSALMYWNGVCKPAGRFSLMGFSGCVSQDVFPFICSTEIHLHQSLNRHFLSKQENVEMAVLCL